MRRLRVLRRLLVKYRAAGKIDKHLYHELYHLSKGNTFKHKRSLIEHVWFLRAIHQYLRRGVLIISADPQGQGREGSREGSQGGDGRQACEDQGCPREEAGACAGEEGCVDRGDRVINYWCWYRYHEYARERHGHGTDLAWQLFKMSGSAFSLRCVDETGLPSHTLGASYHGHPLFDFAGTEFLPRYPSTCMSGPMQKGRVSQNRAIFIF